MQRLLPRSLIPSLSLFAVVAVAAILPFASVLGGLYDIWNLKPEYSHGVIIPVLSAWLIWRQRGELRKLPFTGSWFGLVLIGTGLILRFVGAATTMHTFEHYAFLLVIYGLVLSATGPVIFRRLWMPLGILVFAIPLPSFFDNALSLQLQLLSSQLGVVVIRAAGISVLLEGNVIDLGTNQLEVAEACSGLRYLFPLMTLAFIMSYMLRGAWWKRLAVILSTIPITVFMNSLRIGIVGITVERWGMRAMESTLHDLEGWLVFMFSTAALLLTATGLAKLGQPGMKWRDAFSFKPRSAPGVKSAPVDAPRGITSWSTVPRPFAAAAVLVLFGAISGFATPAPQITSPSRAAFTEIPLLLADWSGHPDKIDSIYLDALRLDDYVLTNYRAPDGTYVNFYAAYYESQDSSRAVHSPHDCIPGGGWQITSLEHRQFPATAGGAAFPMNRAVIQMGPERQVVYYWFQERGRHLTNEYLVRWYLFWDGLTRHRTDGALVRFVAPVPPGGDEGKIDSQMLSLASRIVPTLNRYIPD